MDHGKVEKVRSARHGHADRRGWILHLPHEEQSSVRVLYVSDRLVLKYRKSARRIVFAG